MSDSSGITTQQLVEYADSVAKWSFSAGNNLMWYLNMLAKFPSYSLNNQLLIMGYKADASYIKGYQEWQEMGISVNQDAQVILIIEPVNGNYQVKYMYDASDTNYQYMPQQYDKLQVLEALLTETKNVQVVDQIKNGVRAMYIPESNSIQVKRSNKVSADVFFTSIASELVHENMAQKSEGVYKRAPNQVTARTVAYALGVKYGMDVSDIQLSNLPEKYMTLSDKVSKKELEKIRTSFLEIYTSIEKALEHIVKRDVVNRGRET